MFTKISTIKDGGNGLFTKDQIKKGAVIAEFRGELVAPNVKKQGNNRSIVYFNDGYRLYCDEDDLASFANDCVEFPTVRRKLMKTLRTCEPFYQKHEYANLNAEIILRESDGQHKAFLVAAMDIKRNEEIFCHYGFIYWFFKEATELGFLEEKEIDMKGFPENLHTYVAFDKYIKTFYPDVKKWTAVKIFGKYLVTVKFKGKGRLYINMPNCKERFTRVLASDFDN